MPNEKERAQRDKARKLLKDKVAEAQGTMADVVDDAIEHLLTHYDPKKSTFFKKDFVLIMSSSFFGHEKYSGAPIASGEFFAKGDMHMMSHILATHMQGSKEFAAAIFHAVEVYCHESCKEQFRDGE